MAAERCMRNHGRGGRNQLSTTLQTIFQALSTRLSRQTATRETGGVASGYTHEANRNERQAVPLANNEC
jgi:hypothetical protein